MIRPPPRLDTVTLRPALFDTVTIHPANIYILRPFDPTVGLTQESLFEILARSETRFLVPKFSRDFRETRESKLVARLASRESHRQSFVARIAKSEYCYEIS